MSAAVTTVNALFSKGLPSAAKAASDGGASFAPALELARDLLRGPLARQGAGSPASPGPTPPVDPTAWGSLEELTPIPALSLMLNQARPATSLTATSLPATTAGASDEGLVPETAAGQAPPEASAIVLAGALPVRGGIDLLDLTGLRLTLSAHPQIPGPVAMPAATAPTVPTNATVPTVPTVPTNAAVAPVDGTTIAAPAPQIAVAGAATTLANTPGVSVLTDPASANTPGVLAVTEDAARVPVSGAQVAQSPTAPISQQTTSGQALGATQATQATPAASGINPVATSTGSPPLAVAVAQPPTVRGTGIDREAASSGTQLQPVPVAGALPVQQPPATQAATPAVPVSSVPAPQSAPLATQLYKPVFSLAAAAPGEHLITVRVAPDELGPVTVRAVVTAEGMRVELFAPTDTAREALRGMLPDLRRDLATPGLNASLDVSAKDPSDGGPASGDPDGQDPARRDHSHHLPVPPGESGGIPPDDPATRSGRSGWNQSTLDLLA